MVIAMGTNNRRNKKLLKGYYDTAWYLEWVQTKGKITGAYADKPIKIRGTRSDLNKVRFTGIPNFDTESASEMFETRYNLPYAVKDKLLFSLIKDNNGDYVDEGQITTFDTKFDKDTTVRNLRSRSNNKIFFLGIES
jgi:hypothetical protein